MSNFVNAGTLSKIKRNAYNSKYGPQWPSKGKHMEEDEKEQTEATGTPPESTEGAETTAE